MKFKAKLSLPHTQLLYNLVNPLSRLHSSSMNHSDTSMINVSSSSSSSNVNANAMNNYNSSSSNNNGTTTILYLDNDKLVLSTRGSSHKNDAEGIFCFAELITTDGIGIFNHHVIQSIETDNAILMEVCLVQLKTALRGVLGTQKDMDGRGTGGVANLFSQEVTMKLAKRNGGMPHICLDVRDVNVGEGGIGVHHAIPVRIMRVEELQYHVPPRLGMPDVQLTLPRDRPLKTVVERLKGIAPHVFLEGSMAGILTLRIDSDGASIRTAFNKLIPIHEDCKSSQSQSQTQTQTQQSQSQSESQEEGGSVSGSTSSTQFGSQSQTQTQTQTNRNQHGNGNAPKRRRTQRSQSQTQNNNSQTQTRNGNDEPVKCTVKLDSRKLNASLHWQATLGVRDVSSAVMCMWENEMLVLDVTLNPEIGRFMYYVPVHFVSSDELLS